MAAMRVAMAELLMSGVTTVADLSFPSTVGSTHWRKKAAFAPSPRRCSVTQDGPPAMVTPWNTVAIGMKAPARRRLPKRDGKSTSRTNIHQTVFPAWSVQRKSMRSAELIERAYDHAKDRNLPFQIHAAQGTLTGVPRNDPTAWQDAIRWLHGDPLLDDHSIIGHGMTLASHHPLAALDNCKDLGSTADVGATVAHCPTVFLSEASRSEHSATTFAPAWTWASGPTRITQLSRGNAQRREPCPNDCRHGR